MSAKDNTLILNVQAWMNKVFETNQSSTHINSLDVEGCDVNVMYEFIGITIGGTLPKRNKKVNAMTIRADIENLVEYVRAQGAMIGNISAQDFIDRRMSNISTFYYRIFTLLRSRGSNNALMKTLNNHQRGNVGKKAPEFCANPPSKKLVGARAVMPPPVAVAPQPYVPNAAPSQPPRPPPHPQQPAGPSKFVPAPIVRQNKPLPKLELPAEANGDPRYLEEKSRELMMKTNGKEALKKEDVEPFMEIARKVVDEKEARRLEEVGKKADPVVYGNEVAMCLQQYSMASEIQAGIEDDIDAVVPLASSEDTSAVDTSAEDSFSDDTSSSGYEFKNVYTLDKFRFCEDDNTVDGVVDSSYTFEEF